MPTNKNAMTRYKILDELLSDRYHEYSLDELTEEVNKGLEELYPDTDGVGRRMIEKDIHYLEYEGPFLAEMEHYSAPAYDREKQRSYSKRCIRYKDPSFSIFKKDLSDDEEYLLREALSLLGQFDGLPNLNALENLRLGLGARHSGKAIMSLTRNPLENSNLFGELFTVISQQQVIELHYNTFQNPGKPLQLNVFPYLLKEYNRRWFLFAAAESNNKLLCFGLDRIEKIKPLPSHKYTDYNGNINDIFEDVIGVTIHEESPIYHIVFWVSNLSKDYVATKPIHESQRNVSGEEETNLRQENPELQEGRFFRIDCKENYELIRELTNFGQELIVIQPLYIREKIIKWSEKLYKRYERCFLAK